jgi:hypothetical protein
VDEYRGYIKLYRKIVGNMFWPDKRPYTPLEAWLYILCNAKWRDENVFLPDKKITVPVKRGQLLTSEVKLAEKWKWSRNKVRRFFDTALRTEMTTTHGTAHYTLITVVNYEFYQGEDDEDDTTPETANDTANGTQINNIINNLCQGEIDLLNYLKNIPGYPYKYETDLAQIREWITDHPGKNILEELKKWTTWMRDHSKELQGKRINYRTRFTNWLKPKKWQKSQEPVKELPFL